MGMEWREGGKKKGGDKTGMERGREGEEERQEEAALLRGFTVL